MRRFLFVTLIGFGFCLLTAGGSLAQIRGGAVTLSPMAGSLYFDSEQDLERRPVYNLGLGYNLTDHWAGEFVAGFSETSPKSTDTRLNVYSGRVDLLYHFTPAEPATFYFAMGAGALRYDPRGALSSVEEDDDILFNYGLGLKAMINDTAGFRFDARHTITAENEDFEDKEFNHFSYSAGLYFQFGGGEEVAEVSDSDGDGVSDGLDRCPDTAYGTAVDSLGCEIKQEGPLDSDNDGVNDNLDKCPGTPAGTMVNVHGCPNDADGDGVPNFRDQCADTPEGTEVDLQGCPIKPDGDGDGVEDDLDKCPNTPSYVPVNESGCPRDSDGDFVFDFEDKCPDTPEGDLVDAEGCAVELDEPETVSLDIRFERGSASLQRNQEQDIKKARELLAKYPNATILVEGHTDSTGSEQFNLNLSRERADSVREHLIENLNIDSSRVKAEGFGESRPIAPNSTPEGRMKNRRVQITVEP